MHAPGKALLLPIAILAAAFVAALPARRAEAQDISEETVSFFKQNCTSCHTIGGGKLAGPDLKGVTERQTVEWLIPFVMDPKKVIDSGDPYAQELFRAAKGVYMATLPGMTKDRARKLLELITFESAQEKSRFAGLQISDRPLTQVDVDLGRELFEGKQAFQSGAPACIGCHQVEGTGGFGGGRLGPDLTDVFSRLEGRKALGAWLSAPASPTMQPVFMDVPLDGDEVLALVAYLKSTSEAGQPASGRGSLGFLLAGIAGVVLVLVGFDFIWRRRFRGVRRMLVTRGQVS